jgi:hypothetical protein
VRGALAAPATAEVKRDQPGANARWHYSTNVETSDQERRGLSGPSPVAHVQNLLWDPNLQSRAAEPVTAQFCTKDWVSHTTHSRAIYDVESRVSGLIESLTSAGRT